jgi:general secretion pathway protein G
VSGVRGRGVQDGAGARRSSGFTLIELLVVVAIIGIIVTVASGQYQRSILKAKEAVLKEDLYIMRTAISQYFADKGKYPADLRALVDDSYLKAVPVDPITGSSETWVTEASQADEQDISQEPGISDVRSGAQGQAIDGSMFSEW